jgi:hypothetical protein
MKPSYKSELNYYATCKNETLLPKLVDLFCNFYYSNLL